MPAVRAQFQSLDGGAKVVFVSEGDDAGSIRNGTPVLSLGDFLSHTGHRRYTIAIADSQVRARIAAQCDGAGATPFNVRARTASILDSNEIAAGAVLCDFVIITSNTRIGRHFHANIYSYVAHDCWIGDFVTFAPAVKCNGNVRIDDHAYIGTGAILRPGISGKPLTIGRHAVIGMGAVVTRDVPSHTTVVGNPARPLVQKDHAKT